MKIKINTIVVIFCLAAFIAGAQDRMGIGTDSPDRLLDIEDSNPVVVRVQSTTGGIAMRSGLMLTRAGAGSNRDYQFLNLNGDFRLMTSVDDFQNTEQVLGMDENGYVGLGVANAVTRLQVLGDEEATNTSDGFMIIGDKGGQNLVFDANEIIARNNGAPAPLVFQLTGGDIHLQNGGGNAYLAPSTGYVLAGNAAGDAKFNIGRNDGFQLHLRSNDGGLNEWFIGASESTWAAGDNQLLFSPENLSNSAVFRLTTTDDNNGDLAPVVIRSSASQTLLMDGNEIDSKSGALYINNNTQQNTYFNTNGGEVGIGTSSPNGDLHVKAASGGYALALEKSGNTWNIQPYTNTDNLGFLHNGSLVAHVDDASGAWVALSDANAKSDIRDIESMLPLLKELELKAYSFKFDTSQETQLGFIAQDVRKVLPEVVDEDENGNLSMSYSQFSIVAMKALQEQDKQIEDLEAELSEIVAQLEKMDKESSEKGD